MKAQPGYLQRRPLAEAREILLAGIEPVGEEEIAVDDAAGRIAAADVISRHPAPHYRASAMDGIAVRSADTWKAPLELRAISAADADPAAGEPCCVPVDTGSLL